MLPGDEKKIDLLLDGQLMNQLDLTAADGADLGNPFHSPAYFILKRPSAATAAGIRRRPDFPSGSRSIGCACINIPDKKFAAPPRGGTADGLGSSL